MLDKITSFWQMLDKCWTTFCSNYLLIKNTYNLVNFDVFCNNNTRS